MKGAPLGLVDNSDEILGCASGLAGRRAATGREIMNLPPKRSQRP
ncbi:MAG: hypothetical protein ABIZ50_00355 [Solirubrobacterales bacterium]